jgi:serine/threonine protein kinase/tetratricopeptide (TPR) repeat protein
MIGKTISHYKILEKLGEGGMGVVYKAEDTKLKRHVALKFLPYHLTQDPEAKKRFIHEAQAASALQHNNICTIYEINETDEGQLYISMEHLTGKTLKEKIEEGPLSVEETVDIVTHIARGLEKAHNKKIVHRDIKPANILITEDGVVKIVDFGLAKLAGQTKMTKTGTTLGTVAYMSPEQTQGDDVDHRTDIWALGVILYEMLTGKLPFKGDYDQAVMYSILNEAPESPSAIRKEITVPLEKILFKALEKEPDRRYQTMLDFIQDLESKTPYSKSISTKSSPPQNRIWGIRKPVFFSGLAVLAVAAALAVWKFFPSTPVEPTPEKSLIVLPFANISPDPEQDYFCDGMTEEIIATLSQLGDLLVISRSSAMTFRQTDKTIPEIARMVNVRYVLEGSVRKAGSDLRITAQLIDSKTDAHLWADNYSGTLEDIFSIQENVSRSIADALKIRLGSAGNRILSERPVSDVQAYEYYLKANREILTCTKEGTDRAVEYLLNGLNLLGENAYLYSALAYAYWQYQNLGIQIPGSSNKIKEYANKALALDPDFSKAHAVLGWSEMFSGNIDKSVDHLRRALALNPDEYIALHGMSVIYIWAGKVEAASSFLKRMHQVDPLNPITYVDDAAAYFHAGENDTALTLIENAYRMIPGNPVVRYYYCFILAYSGQTEKSFHMAEQSIEQSPENIHSKLSILMKYALQNEKGKIDSFMTEDFQSVIRTDFGSEYWTAVFYSLINEKDKALKWLERAVEDGYMNYPRLAGKDPFLENIRQEARFQALLGRVKKRWESL